MTAGLLVPESIALDVLAQNMYWTDSGTGTIRRARLDGSNVEDLVVGIDPTGIALDIPAGKMYWPENASDRIRRSNLDGSNIEDVVTSNVGEPRGLALDTEAGQIYWVDSGLDAIQRSNLDGSSIETIITGLSNPRVVALDVQANKMYWTDLGTAKIQRANLDGSGVEDLVSGGMYREGLVLTSNASSQPLEWAVGTGGNGHFYEFVSVSGITWTAARAAARAKQYQGLAGYLLTSTSACENNFVRDHFTNGTMGSGWIGASDSIVEGEWRWVEGPEAGIQFWQGGVSGSVTPPFNFAAWISTDPNDADVPYEEDFGVMALGSWQAVRPGEWGDANDAGVNGFIAGYFVEYSNSEIPGEDDPPYIVHGAGQFGETHPFTGYVDPRSESHDGETYSLGIQTIEIRFSEPVQAVGGGSIGVDSFEVTSTGGTPPVIDEIDATQNPFVIIEFDSFPPLKEWTTVRAFVQDRCGNVITDNGNLGPGINEPDRIDFLFLPGDITQDGFVTPLDLIRFRQIIAGYVTPDRGLLEDYADTNRNGLITPLDIVRYRQLLNGAPPATQVWGVESGNHPQP